MSQETQTIIEAIATEAVTEAEPKREPRVWRWEPDGLLDDRDDPEYQRPGAEKMHNLTPKQLRTLKRSQAIPNIYFLEDEGRTNTNFWGDEPEVLGSSINGVLVECSFDEASRFAIDWGLSAPLLAKDGIHTSESGSEVFIADGEQVKSANDIVMAIGSASRSEELAIMFLQDEGMVF